MEIRPGESLSVSDRSPDQVAFCLPAGAVIINDTYSCRKIPERELLPSLILTMNRCLLSKERQIEIHSLPVSVDGRTD